MYSYNIYSWNIITDIKIINLKFRFWRLRCLTVLSEDIGVKIILWVLEENSTNNVNLLKTNH